MFTNLVYIITFSFKNLENAATAGDLEAIRDIVFGVNLVPAKTIISNWEKDGLRLAQRLEKDLKITTQFSSQSITTEDQRNSSREKNILIPGFLTTEFSRWIHSRHSEKQLRHQSLKTP